LSAELDRFRELLAQRLGLQFDDNRLGFLADVLVRRGGPSLVDRQSYLQRIEASSPRQELSALAEEVTIGETYFFRNGNQFKALAEVAIPERLRVLAGSRRLRLLSAGCSSGEEPYSLAITCRELLPDPAAFSVLAVDVNPAALARAGRARYSSWSLRETPVELQRRWFRTDGREQVLERAHLGEVVFQEKNLSLEDPELWAPGAYDVVFCRNVLMYFAPRSARAVVARIHRALAPGGYLFMGHAETLRDLSEAFELRHTHETFYYQSQTDPAPAVEATAWADLVQASAQRIERLGETVVPSEPPPPPDLSAALALLEEERYSEALERLAGVPPSDPDALLLRALLLIHSGARAAAAPVCEDLLVRGQHTSGAHYLLGLCAEEGGDRASAQRHHREAARLDPTFAMPRLHLGLVARRAGDRQAAKRELERAALLLAGEQPARVRLFGGGFSRSALIALCRSEEERR
jgi:chemotaxis protein methyltransferase CheR